MRRLGDAVRDGFAYNVDRRLKGMLKSEAVCISLSLAALIAVSIDIHIRSNAIGSMQLGLWIANYVEPSLSGVGFQTPPITSDIFEYRGWEQFLRISGDAQGLHFDPLQQIFFWAGVHFLTYMIYLIYLWVLQEVCLSGRYKGDAGVAGGFVLLHLALALFAWNAHEVPSVILSQPIAFLDYWGHGPVPPALYLIPCLLLVLISLPYLVPKK